MRINVILLMLALLLTGCAASPSTPPTFRQITAQEAAEIMAREEGYILLDVRTEQEFADGHIPGAICIPNETIGTDELSQLPDHDQLILVYCRSGNRSKQAAEKLVNLGYANVVEFGGINNWHGEIVAE